MHLPRYYLPQPALAHDAATIQAFEALWARIASPGGAGELAYALPAPRWQFLSYLADHKPVVLHGSGQAGLAEIQPRQTNDVNEFGNRCAIYAASDGIWPIFFAILDRERYPMSLTNACFRVVAADGEQSGPWYFFSISQPALQHQPWRTGNVYILPRASFEQQPPIASDGAAVHVQQWAGTQPVRPLASIAVGPGDFPFLSQIRGHDDQVQAQRASANPDAFPWVDDDA